jgi:hypothetical protein
MIQLLPNVLLVTSGMKSVAERLSRAFSSAWERIPSADQNLISGYFAQKPCQIYLFFRMDYGERPMEPWGETMWYEDDKTLLGFLAPFVVHPTKLEVVSRVIAHELAHCYHKATGAWTSDEKQEEINARQTAKVWGLEEPKCGDEKTRKMQIEAWRRAHPEKKHLTQRRLVEKLARAH